MSCKEFREGHPALPADGKAHQAGCADCRSFARSWDLLKDYVALEPSTGFFRGIRIVI